MNHCGKGFERAREVIRGHARLLFIRNGHEKTTMQQVAELETAVRHRPADEGTATTALLSVLDVWRAQGSSWKPTRTSGIRGSPMNPSEHFLNSKDD